MATSLRYRSLPQSEDATHSLVDHDTQETGPYPNTMFTRSAFVLVCALTVFDVVCLLYVATMHSSSFSLAAAPQPLNGIPFLSTYARLDNVYSTTSQGKRISRPSIINTPRALTHIDSSHPDYVQPVWPKRYGTEGGMVPFDERHVVVTETISTIAEYHAMDYGMENCTIVLSLPPSKAMPNQPMLARNGTLDIWLLAPRSIDFTQLNWNSKPERRRHIGTFVPVPGSTQKTKGYYCKTGSTQVVEVSCGEGDCKVHVPASGHDAIGLYILQDQTI